MTDADLKEDGSLMVAWRAFEKTEQYANVVRWCAQEKLRNRCLLYAFREGFLASEEARLVEEKTLKRNDVHDMLLLIVVLGVLFLVLMSSPAHCQVQHQTPPAPLSVRYVDNQYPNASDSNDGKTEQTPWLTIEHAMATIAAGTTCYVKAGDYYPSTQGAYVELLHSGSPGSWVTLAAYPGDKGFVVVHGRGLLAEQRSYLEFRGLRVVDTPDKGILVLGPGVDGVRVLGCETYDTFSSGISVQGVRYPADPGDYDNVRDVLISGNDVRLATHGGADECITIAWGVSGLSVVGNIVADGELYESPRLGDEGIDLKEGVRDAVVEGNLLFNLGHNAIYLEAGRGSPSFPAGPDPVLGDILVTRNVVHDTRSNGISVTTEGRGVVDGVTITNNLVFRTEHNGVILYDQSGGGTIQNVSVVNNTTAYCGGDPNEYLSGEYEFGGGI